MEGIVINYRRGKRTMHPKQMILEFPDEPHPSSLIGKKVFWESPGGKKIYGAIIAIHGRKGAVRARFTKGLPGQAIGDRVYLVGGTKGSKSKQKKPTRLRDEKRSSKTAHAGPSNQKKPEKPKAKKKKEATKKPKTSTPKRKPSK